MTEVANKTEVRVEAGDTIARRFVVVRPEEADLPGVDLYLGRDTRLGGDVTIHVVTSLAPSSVVRAAQRARVLRDQRLVRVLAAATERTDGERVSYVVTERPHGVRLDELIGEVAFAPESACAVVGGAAAALAVAARAGEHHGMVRARSVVVTGKGRVVVAGLGIDGELAAQDGLGRGRSEKADAQALARLYLAAVTAKDADDVVVEDLPDDLTASARALCIAVIKGKGPRTLAEVTGALGTGNHAVLRALVNEAPRLWWPRAAGGLVPDAVDIDGPAGAVEPAVDDFIAGPEASEVDNAPHVQAGQGETQGARGADVVLAPEEGEIVVEEPDTIEPDVPARPLTRFGKAVDDLDEFHDIVADQNAEVSPAVMEAILERLHRRFPASEPLSRAAEAAHRRAQAPAPIRPGPLLVSLMIIAMFVASVIALSRIQEPLEPPGPENPPQQYPEFSFGPDATMSPAE